jgi:hypothetical protein
MSAPQEIAQNSNVIRHLPTKTARKEITHGQALWNALTCARGA